MGWTFMPFSTRRETINGLVESREWVQKDGSKVERKCIAKCYKGSSFAGTLYAVFEDKVTKDGVAIPLPDHRWIFIALLRYSNYQNERSWGYKDMEESMGPCESKCPLSYFDMVPCPDSNEARRWRERCRWDREVVALKTSLNKKLRKGEILRQDAQLQYNEAVKALRERMAVQDAAFQKELDEKYTQKTAEAVTA